MALAPTVLNAGPSFLVFMSLMIPTRSLFKMVEIGQGVRPLKVKVQGTHLLSYSIYGFTADSL